jgi:hypothetical protein
MIHPQKGAVNRAARRPEFRVRFLKELPRLEKCADRIGSREQSAHSFLPSRRPPDPLTATDFEMQVRIGTGLA